MAGVGGSHGRKWKKRKKKEVILGVEFGGKILEIIGWKLQHH